MFVLNKCSQIAMIHIDVIQYFVHLLTHLGTTFAQLKTLLYFNIFQMLRTWFHFG
jgi:hypothetical protein